MQKPASVAILLTGNELMTGDIVDSNSVMMAEKLAEIGLKIRVKSTVGDELALLCAEMRRLSACSDVLLVNGGLGPTADDLTAQALAEVMGVSLVEHEGALEHLLAWCAKRNYPLNEANRKQAMLPQGVELVPNGNGTAVGFRAPLGDCTVICTPGVPPELALMLDKEILPTLRHLASDTYEAKRIRLRLFGIGESSLQQKIKDNCPDWPEALELGFRASLPLLELKLQVEKREHHALLPQWEARMRELFGEHVVTDDQQSMGEVLVAQLLERGLKVTCAESCTGGLIASLLTQVSGASAVFEAGYVTYSNDIKQRLLGVSERSLQQHGAVSEAVVKEMLSGALHHSGADLGVAVSGVAGPSGGSEEKPVGTVWLAWGSATLMRAREFYFPMSRKRFQLMVATLALDLLRRHMLGSTEEPWYFAERQRQKG